MVRTAAEVLREQLERLNAGDVEGSLAFHHPEIEIITRDPDVAIVGRWRGVEGYRALLAEWADAWDDVTYEVEEVDELGGGRLFVVVTYRGRGKDSGATVESRFFWVCEYRDGLLNRWETFAGREAAERVAYGS